MVQQLNSFASEVTRVAREVGTEGKLGGQAVLTGVAGTWKDLTESVNSMASNLTDQVRISRASLLPWRGRLDHQDLPWTHAAKFWSSRTPSTPWWTSSARSPPK